MSNLRFKSFISNMGPLISLYHQVSLILLHFFCQDSHVLQERFTEANVTDSSFHVVKPEK